MITGAEIEDTKTEEFSEISVASVFEVIGHTAKTGFLKGQIKTDEIGYIIAVSATGTGTGCMAAIDAEHWLQDMGIV